MQDRPEQLSTAAVDTAELLDALPLATAVLDADLTIRAWNQAAESLLGWSAPAANGRHISLIVEDERSHEQQAAFEWARTTRRSFEYEAVRRRADGEPVAIRISITPLLRGDDVVGYVATGHEPPADPPARPAATDHAIAELRARNGELARANARLETDLQEVRRINQRLRRFAHAASHDLAQPLAALGGYLELLDGDDAGLDARARDWVAKARRGHRAVMDAVDATLRHAAAVSDRVQRTPLGDLVESVTAAISPTIRSAGAVVDVEPGGTVDVDPDVFARALQNLLVNACRYRDDDRPLRVQVRHEAVGDVDLVRVVDNGRGFAPGEHERVFLHGERGAAATGRPGTGAGLATVRSIVEDLGGRVWAEDTPGGGATVAIALPRRDEHGGGEVRGAGSGGDTR